MADLSKEQGVIESSQNPLDALRCINCGGARSQMVMLNIKELDESLAPSIFIAYALCDACDDHDRACGERVLQTLAQIVQAAKE